LGVFINLFLQKLRKVFLSIIMFLFCPNQFKNSKGVGVYFRQIALFLIILLSIVGCEDKKKKPILDINYSTGEELIITDKNLDIMEKNRTDGEKNLSSIGKKGRKEGEGNGSSTSPNRLLTLSESKLPPPSPPTPVSRIETSGNSKGDSNAPKTIIYQLGDYNITFRNGKIIRYPRKRLYLLFSDGSRYCRVEEQFLKELHIPYYVIKDADLNNKFKISIYPTIVILDKHREIRYEGFTPYEILQAETYFQLGKRASHRQK